MPFADYTVTSSNLTAPIGYSAACYTGASACSTAENNATCTANGFSSCSCDAADAVSCSSSHYSVVGINTASTTTTLSDDNPRSQEHTSELQSLMRISYAVFCLQTKQNIQYDDGI